jgi:hypothetical protein
MLDEKYCICCGETVPFNTTTRNGNLELTCVYCGFESRLGTFLIGCF